MKLDHIQTLLKPELEQLKQLIFTQTSTDTALINSIGSHLITNGGKRLRPIIALLSAKCFNYQKKYHIFFAAVIEFFHTSSLLHDDVVDESVLRRGKKTAHTLWGDKASILVGDYFFSKAFELMLEAPEISILKLLATTANFMTKGELKQLMFQTHTQLTLENYMDIIHYKTAALFEVAAQIGPLLTSYEPYQLQAMKSYGLHLGNAFQITDDILDYLGPCEETGKNTGTDLEDGKITLPIIFALQHCNTLQKKFIEETFQARKKNNFNDIVHILHETNALNLAKHKAETEIDEAITALLHIEESPYRDALEQTALLTLDRKS